MTDPANKGKGRIETLWEGYRTKAVPPTVGPIQIRESRQAFFAGAIAGFYSIFANLGEGDDPTDEEMAFIAAIDDELHEFGEQFDVAHMPPSGSA